MTPEAMTRRQYLLSSVRMPRIPYPQGEPLPFEMTPHDLAEDVMLQLMHGADPEH